MTPVKGARCGTSFVPPARFVTLLAVVFAGTFKWYNRTAVIAKGSMRMIPAAPFQVRLLGAATVCDRVITCRTARRFTTNPKQLTREISQATSAQSVLQVLQNELDNPIFNEFHLSAAFTILARYKSTFMPGVRTNPTLRALADKVGVFVKSGGLSARTSANIFWAVAALRNTALQFKDMVPLLIDYMEGTVLDMEPQGISNTLWACATLGMGEAELHGLVPLLEERIVDRADYFEAQQISNVIWGIATLRDKVPALQSVLPVLAEMVEEKLDAFIPQDISNIIWAIGFLKDDTPELLECLPSLSSRAAAKVSMMNSQQLANICAGLAACGLDGGTFSTGAALRIVDLLPRLGHRDLVLGIPQVFWGFATWGIYNRGLLHKTAHFIPKALRSFPDWHVCVVLWSYRKLDLQDEFGDIQSMLAREIARRGLCDNDVNRSSLGSRRWREV